MLISWGSETLRPVLMTNHSAERNKYTPNKTVRCRFSPHNLSASPPFLCGLNLLCRFGEMIVFDGVGWICEVCGYK